MKRSLQTRKMSRPSFNCGWGISSLYTEKHSTHDEVWLLQNSSSDVVCFACAVETLEDETSLNIRKRKMVSEMLDLLTTNKAIWTLFSRNNVILRHTGKVLLKLLSTNDRELSAILVDTLGVIVQKSRDENALSLLESLVNTLREMKDSKMKIPNSYVCLLGKVFRSSSKMLQVFVDDYQWVLEMITENIDKVPETDAISYWYVFAQVYRNEDARNINIETTKTLLAKFVDVVAKATSKELQLNILAVLKHFAGNELLRNLIFEFENQEILESRKSIAETMKKMLLSTHQDVQIGAVQCLTVLLDVRKDRKSVQLIDFVGILIDKGLCEFLFELSNSSNAALVSSVLNCLLRFSSFEKFFKAGHLIYGFEPIVQALGRTVERKDKVSLNLGLMLLLKILEEIEKNLCSVEKQRSSVIALVMNLSEVQETSVLNHVAACAAEFLKKLSNVDMRVMEFMHKLLENFGRTILSKAKSMSTKTTVDPEMLILLKNGLDFVGNCFKLLVNEEKNGHFETNGGTPHSQQSNLNGLLQHLHNVADIFYIPATVILLPFVNQAAILVSFFDLLGSMLKKLRDVTFAKKLCESSFVRLASELKSRFMKSDSPNLHAASIDSFLIALSCNLESEQYSSQLQCILLEVLPLLKAPPSEWHLYFGRKASNVEDTRMIQDVRIACLALLYTSTRFGDGIWRDEVVCKRISHCIQDGSIVCDFPEVTKRHLVYMWSHASERLGKGVTQFVDANMQILSELEQAQDVNMFFFNESCFIRWILNSPSHQKANVWVLAEMTSQMLSTSQGTMESNFDEIINILSSYKNNYEFYATCIDVVACGTQKVVQKLVEVIASLLQKSDNSCFVLRIKETIHKILLTKGAQLDHTNLTGLFQVYRCLPSIENEPILDIDLKLANRSCNVYVECQDLDVRLAILNWLTQLLYIIQQSGGHSHLTVAYNESFLKEVSSSLPRKLQFPSPYFEKVSAATLIFTSQLAKSVTSQSIQTETLPVIMLSKRLLIKGLLFTDSPLIQLACCQFWNEFLQLEHGKVYVLQQHEESAGPMRVDLNDLRTLLFQFQNLLLCQDNLVKEIAIKCLAEVLKVLRKSDTEFRSPWNAFLLELLTESLQVASEKVLHLKAMLVLVEAETPIQQMRAFQKSVTSLLKEDDIDQGVELLLLKLIFFVIDKCQLTDEEKNNVSVFLHRLEDRARGFTQDKTPTVEEDKPLFVVASGVLFPNVFEKDSTLTCYLSKIEEYRVKLNNPCS